MPPLSLLTGANEESVHSSTMHSRACLFNIRICDRRFLRRVEGKFAPGQPPMRRLHMKEVWLVWT